MNLLKEKSKNYFIFLCVGLFVLGTAIGSAATFIYYKKSRTSEVIMQEAQENLWRYLGDVYAAHWKDYLRDVPSWLGVPMLQMPFDLFYMEELIVQSQPEVIIETGTYKGGSALFLATVLQQVHPEGMVITVDVRDVAERHPQDYKIVRRQKITEKIKFIVGSSTDPKVVNQIKSYAEGKRVFVALDSDHEAAHVYEELKTYAPLVQVGGYIVVQDVEVDNRMQAVKEQPRIAIEKFIKENPSFIVDTSRKPFLLSKYVGGVLKRIK